MFWVLNPDHVDHQTGALTTRPRCRQKEEKIQKEVFYSIAIDESIDNTDSALVLAFILAITGDFHCFEELLCLCTLKDRTRGIDIFNAFKEKCNKAKLSFANFFIFFLFFFIFISIFILLTRRKATEALYIG